MCACARVLVAFIEIIVKNKRETQKKNHCLINFFFIEEMSHRVARLKEAKKQSVHWKEKQSRHVCLLWLGIWTPRLPIALFSQTCPMEQPCLSKETSFYELSPPLDPHRSNCHAVVTWRQRPARPWLTSGALRGNRLLLPVLSMVDMFTISFVTANTVELGTWDSGNVLFYRHKHFRRQCLTSLVLCMGCPSREKGIFKSLNKGYKK